MTVVGIICEYNPLHLGHVRQFGMIRRACGPDAVIVCLMSGNFVQRGAPAIFDKAVRAQAAVEAGADLVLELPLTAAIQSAEGFAENGVKILAALGTDTLSFGCESGDLDAIMHAAQAVQRPEFSETLRMELASGVSYARARQLAAQALGADASVMERPNDILALEYCRAILRFAPQMQPLAIRRPGDYRGECESADAPSAATLRRLILTGGDWEALVPPQARELYRSACVHAPAFGERAVLARLRALTQEQWQSTPYTSEGLWSKAQRAVQREGSLEAICAAVRSRRYPMTRVQRMLLCAYLGIDRQTLLAPPPYVRVLAFDGAGRAALREAKKRGAQALVNAGAQPPDRAYYALECRAADLFSLFSQPDMPPDAGSEQKTRIFQKKN